MKSLEVALSAHGVYCRHDGMLVITTPFRTETVEVEAGPVEIKNKNLRVGHDIVARGTGSQLKEVKLAVLGSTPGSARVIKNGKTTVCNKADVILLDGQTSVFKTYVEDAKEAEQILMDCEDLEIGVPWRKVAEWIAYYRNRAQIDRATAATIEQVGAEWDESLASRGLI